MRRPLLALSAATALALTGCAGDADDGTGTATESTGTTGTATAPDGEPATPSPSPTGGTDATTPDADGSPTGDADVAGLAFTDCTTERYTIGYPADWRTNTPDEHTDACTIFHPGEIDTPDQPQDRELHWAVTAFVDPVSYEEVRDADQGTNEELHRETLTVDGHDAFVVEYRSSGDALLPEGERGYRYTVDLDGEILVVVTYSVGDTDYERDKAILDRMVTEELDLTA